MIQVLHYIFQLVNVTTVRYHNLEQNGLSPETDGIQKD